MLSFQLFFDNGEKDIFKVDTILRDFYTVLNFTSNLVLYRPPDPILSIELFCCGKKKTN